jgi:hypothetical protein
MQETHVDAPRHKPIDLVLRRQFMDGDVDPGLAALKAEIRAARPE